MTDQPDLPAMTQKVLNLITMKRDAVERRAQTPAATEADAAINKRLLETLTDVQLIVSNYVFFAPNHALNVPLSFVNAASMRQTIEKLEKVPKRLINETYEINRALRSDTNGLSALFARTINRDSNEIQAIANALTELYVAAANTITAREKMAHRLQIATPDKGPMNE